MGTPEEVVSREVPGGWTSAVMGWALEEMLPLLLKPPKMAE